MKQIKPILSTILLLLLLTSISYGWVPPPINSPVLIDETDADPWGGTLVSGNKAEAARGIIASDGQLIETTPIRNSQSFAVKIIRLVLFRNITPIISFITISLDDERYNNKKP
jgi:hypothetical protein